MALCPVKDSARPTITAPFETSTNMQKFRSRRKGTTSRPLTPVRFYELFRTTRNKKARRLETLEETYRKLTRTKVIRNIITDLPGFQQPPTKRARQAVWDEQLSGSNLESVGDCEMPSILELELTRPQLSPGVRAHKGRIVSPQSRYSSEAN